MKKIFLLTFCILFYNFLFAQTLSDAIKLTDDEQYESATDAFKSLIAKEPANANYYAYMGDNYLFAENPDSALATYKKGEQVDAKNPLVKIGLAKYNLDKYDVREMKKLSDIAAQNAATAKSNYDKMANKTPADQAKVNDAQVRANEAMAKYNDAVSLVKEANALIDEAIILAGPKNADAFIEAADALIHFKNKDLDKAKTFLDKATALQPKNSEIKILYGDIYSELNNGTLAAQYYNEALDMNPHSAKATVDKGRLYRRSTNNDGASEEFKNAIKIDDSYAPAHRELGEVYFKLGKLDLAKQEYKRYLDLSKNNCGARGRYAYFLYYTKDYNGALKEVAQLKNCPSTITTLRIKAYGNYEIKDSANALASVKELFAKMQEGQAVELDYEYYGRILEMNGQDSLAAEYLHKAFLLDNSRCDLLTEMWKIYDRTKDYANASKVLEEKMQNCKGFTSTEYYNLGRSYFFNKDFQKADSAFAKVNQLLPTWPSGFLWRAESNSNLDTTSSLGLAKPYYEKYIEVAKADTTGMAGGKYKGALTESYRYLASYYYLQMHDKEKAKENLRKILELDPTDKDAQNAIKGIDYEEKEKQKKKP